MRQHVSQLSAKTYYERRSMLDHDEIPAWSRRIVDTIKKREAIALVDSIVERGAPVQANRHFEMLRAFFNWCVSKDIIKTSPLDGARRPTKEESRERALTEDEVRRFWRATEETGGFCDLFRLMAVTAQRESEVGKMRWSEIDFDRRTWTIPAGRAKNDRAHEVHLTDQAIEILSKRERKGEFIFPSARPRKVNRGKTVLSGFSRAKKKLDAAMEPDEPWKLHDLRRTVTTMLAEIGVAPHVADKVLNHRSGTIKGVAAIYNRHDYRKEARQALEAWAERLAAIVG
jgi:integrase